VKAGIAHVRRGASVLVVAATFFSSSVQPSVAQTQGSRTTEPGQIERRIEKQPEAPAPTAPIAPALRPSEATPEAPDAGADFVLSAVSIVGATAYELAEFAPLYERFLGRVVSTADIQGIVKAITKKYVDDGYFLSSASAPPQNLAFGILTIEVREGYIEKVVFKGDRPGRQSLFDAWAEAITQSVPARLSDVERTILLMGDLPGVSATPSLNEPPGNEPGYEMTIAIRHDPVDAGVSLDNRGTHPVGPLEASASIGLNSVAGQLERTRLSVFTVPDEPEELLYGEVYEQLPVGTGGTIVWGSASRSKVDIYSQSRASQLQSTGNRISLGFWHPLVRQQEFALYVNGRIEHADSRQSAFNDNFNDRLRVARAGLRLWFKDGAEGTNNINLELSEGFDVLNASPRGYQVSRSLGESRFDKATLDVNRIQKVTEDFWAEFNGRGQYSDHILLSGEELGLGGSRFGRGYDPSEISDSRGVAGALELRHRFPAKEGLLSDLWLYAFYDAGAVWRSDGERDSIASTGGGLRLFPWDGAVASVEIAKPLTRLISEEGNRKARLFFNVAVNF
jgi:hemolysin activation/secretion protein